MNRKLTSFFKTQPVFSISEINWWLLKFSDYFKVSSARSTANNTIQINDGSTVYLPPLSCYENEDDRFISIYKDLDELTQIHKLEDYAKSELLKYNKIKTANQDILQWVSQNEKVYNERLILFFTTYLDYSLNDKEIIDLLAYRKKEDLDIFVDRKYFKNLIQFTLLFEAHYYNNHSLLAKLK